jgi:hypothetical protein
LSERSATVANTIVDLVVLLPDLAIERRRPRCLRNAWPRDSCAGRRQVVLIQTLPGRRLAELRSDKTVVLPVRRHARGRGKKEGGDDYRFGHDPTLANEDVHATQIALICIGFKRPTRLKCRSDVLTISSKYGELASNILGLPAVDKP